MLNKRSNNTGRDIKTTKQIATNMQSSRLSLLSSSVCSILHYPNTCNYLVDAQNY